MEIGDWATTRDLNDIYRDVRKLGLETCVAEHEAFGFTVIPPEKVAAPDFIRRLRQAMLDVHERRTGQKIAADDIDTASLDKAQGSRPIDSHWHVLGEDPIFEEALMNPAVLAMARFLLGKSVTLSDLHIAIKHADPTINRPTHALHTDGHGPPPPLAQYAQVINITWAMTDYTRDSGPLAIVPGSHRFGRIPEPYESDFLREDAPVPAIPVECEAGSLIVWGGNTWHGSFPRQRPGLRMNLLMLFTRLYMKPIQDFRATIAAEVLERNTPEFARLMGMNSLYPVPKEGPNDIAKVLAYTEQGRSQWG